MSAKALLTYVLTPLLLALALAFYRLHTILDPKRLKPHSRSRHRRDVNDPTQILIVLGSGGHTAEMIAMLERAVFPEQGEEGEGDEVRLDWRSFKRRTWVVSEGDEISAQRARGFERTVAERDDRGPEDKAPQQQQVNVVAVPRARAIHQPLYTAPISSLRCLYACLRVLLSGGSVPDIILTNGPATATILILASIILRFLNVRGCNSQGKMRTVYVESWARVRKLSLSGMLLEWVVDRFIVQWPQLLEGDGKWGQRKREYLGVLV